MKKLIILSALLISAISVQAQKMPYKATKVTRVYNLSIVNQKSLDSLISKQYEVLDAYKYSERNILVVTFIKYSR